MSDGAEIILLVGRLMFLAFFVQSAVGHLRHSAMIVGYATTKGMPLPLAAGWPTGVLQLGAGAMVALGIFADVAFLAIAAFVLVVAFMFHDFWAVPEGEKQTQEQSFFRNITFAGGALALFGFWAVYGGAVDLAVTDQLIDLS